MRYWPLAGSAAPEPTGESHGLVTLRPMTPSEFETFLEASIAEYASEKVRAGNWSTEEAPARSRAAHTDLLPHGLASARQHLYTIEVDGAAAGHLWLCSDPATAGGAGFIYDLYVDEPFRHRGIATAAMQQAELEAGAMGLTHLALHVFGHNTAARALYQKLGYEVTNINMVKTLSPSPSARDQV